MASALAPHMPSTPIPDSGDPAASTLADRYRAVRAHPNALCAPLEGESYVVRSIPDASPAKSHLARTNWLCETVVLRAHAAACGVRYAPRNESYAFLFNSYYIQPGERHCRA
jgi:hypothetical protein